MENVIYKTEKYCYKISCCKNMTKNKIYVNHIKKHINNNIQKGGDLSGLLLLVGQIENHINSFFEKNKKKDEIISENNKKINELKDENQKTFNLYSEMYDESKNEKKKNEELEKFKTIATDILDDYGTNKEKEISNLKVSEDEINVMLEKIKNELERIKDEIE